MVPTNEIQSTAQKHEGLSVLCRDSGKFECAAGEPEALTCSIKSHAITQAQAENQMLRDTSGCEYKLFLNGLEFNIPYRDHPDDYKKTLMASFLKEIKSHNNFTGGDNPQIVSLGQFSTQKGILDTLECFNIDTVGSGQQSYIISANDDGNGQYTLIIDVNYDLDLDHSAIKTYLENGLSPSKLNMNAKFLIKPNGEATCMLYCVDVNKYSLQ
ncbi:hypothetical protein [Iodobacter fluviatilis]|nr:hypothetical protein [Iodobacter fluviatilis]